MSENEIGTAVLEAAFKVHTALGPGLLESVYEAALAWELAQRGLEARRQVEVPVRYLGVDLGLGFRADLIVAGRVLVELKSVEALAPVHGKTVTNYLRLGGWKLGYLINFNLPHLKDGIVRLVNGLEEPARLRGADLRKGAERLTRQPPHF